MPPLYRLAEVAVYALLNFLPFLALALYPFRRCLRFFRRLRFCCFSDRFRLAPAAKFVQNILQREALGLLLRSIRGDMNLFVSQILRIIFHVVTKKLLCHSLTHCLVKQYRGCRRGVQG